MRETAWHRQRPREERCGPFQLFIATRNAPVLYQRATRMARGFPRSARVTHDHRHRSVAKQAWKRQLASCMLSADSDWERYPRGRARVPRLLAVRISSQTADALTRHGVSETADLVFAHLRVDLSQRCSGTRGCKPACLYDFIS